jgi:lipase chaperone LimK
VPDGLKAVQAAALLPLPAACREAAGCTVLPYAELKRLFDYYLSTVGEQSVDAIAAQVRTVLATHLKPAQLPAAEGLLSRYLAFKKALFEVEQQFSKKAVPAAGLRDRFEAMRQLRERFFNAQESQAMFGAEDAQDLDALARLDIVNDKALSAADKQARLQALDQQLPASLREDREAPRAVLRLEAQVAALRAAGASEDEVFRARAKALDSAAASRFAELDHEERAWQQRIEDYLAERKALLSSKGNASESEQQAALSALQASRFTEGERKRLPAYEP